MRAVLHQDIVALATCLLTRRRDDRRAYAELQIKLAHAADRYRKRFGKAHVVFGNGTLASCCAKQVRKADRRLDDVEYADCMIKALEAVVRFRNRNDFV